MHKVANKSQPALLSRDNCYDFSISHSIDHGTIKISSYGLHCHWMEKFHLFSFFLCTSSFIYKCLFSLITAVHILNNMLSFSLTLRDALGLDYDKSVSFYMKLLSVSEPIEYKNKAGCTMRYLLLGLGSESQLVKARSYQLHERRNLQAGNSYLVTNVSIQQ